MQWPRTSIPNFQSLITQLHNFLESVNTHVGKRTKRAVGRVSLDTVGWTPEHTIAFDACKTAITARVHLAHRDESKRLCIYTDASDTHWPGIVTQVPYSDLSLPHADQSHDPLALYSGRFYEVQVGWCTVEKEAFAVLARASARICLQQLPPALNCTPTTITSSSSWTQLLSSPTSASGRYGMSFVRMCGCRCTLTSASTSAVSKTSGQTF